MRGLFFIFVLALSGCIRQPLIVYTDFVNREDLASVYVETPDPALNCPDVGQRLVISWALPWEYKNRDDIELEYTVRLHDHTEIHNRFPLTMKSGYETYFVKNEEFFKSGGIATFKVVIYGCEGVIYEWIHPLWSELIEIGNKQ